MPTDLWQRAVADRSAPAYHFGTYRAATPADTLRRIGPLARQAGVTRLAGITGLDTVGVPAYQAVRPDSRNISLSNGKGLTRDQAKVSALMEALECHHAEELHQPTCRATVGAMRRQLDYDPYCLAVVRRPVGSARRGFDYNPFLPPVGRPCLLNDRTVVDWIAATDLHSGNATWVPRQLCELNFCVEERLGLPWFRATSNGLASGNTFAEAVLHGLCEVIERDGIGRSERAGAVPERCIDPVTVASRPARSVLRRFARAGLKVQMVDLSGPTGLPCFEACICGPDHAAYRGFGCHPSRETALVRALTEAAQSRVSHIAGTRDDMYRETYRQALHSPDLRESPVFAVEPCSDFTCCPDVSVGSWGEVLTDVVDRVRAVTGMAPVAVDLTRSEFGIPVAFVVAPGLGALLPHRR